MPKKGTKYMRKIFTKDEDTAKEVCDLLKDYNPVILDDAYNFYSGYFIVYVQASKDEFSNLIKELGLVYSNIIIRDIVHRVWMYMGEHSDGMLKENKKKGESG